VLYSKGKNPLKIDWQVTQALIHAEFLRFGACTVGKRGMGPEREIKWMEFPKRSLEI